MKEKVLPSSRRTNSLWIGKLTKMFRVAFPSSLRKKFLRPGLRPITLLINNLIGKAVGSGWCTLAHSIRVFVIFGMCSLLNAPAAVMSSFRAVNSSTVGSQ